MHALVFVCYKLLVACSPAAAFFFGQRDVFLDFGDMHALVFVCYKLLVACRPAAAFCFGQRDALLDFGDMHALVFVCMAVRSRRLSATGYGNFWAPQGWGKPEPGVREPSRAAAIELSSNYIYIHGHGSLN
jgi:hypothetical protein